MFCSGKRPIPTTEKQIFYPKNILLCGWRPLTPRSCASDSSGAWTSTVRSCALQLVSPCFHPSLYCPVVAPRAIKKRMHVDPTDLLPQVSCSNSVPVITVTTIVASVAHSPFYQLPSPEELKPFPCRLGREYIGHSSVVTCVDVHSSGQYIVTGSKDCTAKVRCCCCCCCCCCIVAALPNKFPPFCRFGTS